MLCLIILLELWRWHQIYQLMRQEVLLLLVEGNLQTSLVELGRSVEQFIMDVRS